MVAKYVAFAPEKMAEKMGPGPIFSCYVLKLRTSSLLQNGACPHFFSEAYAFAIV